MGNVQQGIADMEEARREKATEEHNVIDDAIQDRGEGYTVFSIVGSCVGRAGMQSWPTFQPVGVLYRPSEKKLKNVSTKDYLGKAKLVAAADSADAFTTFTGSTLLMQGRNMSGAYVDQPPTLSAAAAAARVPSTFHVSAMCFLIYI
jgi:neutrophil factor 2